MIYQRKKNQCPSEFLIENQLLGPQELIDVKRILQDPGLHPSRVKIGKLRT